MVFLLNKLKQYFLLRFHCFWKFFFQSRNLFIYFLLRCLQSWLYQLLSGLFWFYHWCCVMLAWPFLSIKIVSCIFYYLVSGWCFIISNDKLGLITGPLKVSNLPPLTGSTVGFIVLKQVWFIVILFEGYLVLVGGFISLHHDLFLEVHLLV